MRCKLLLIMTALAVMPGCLRRYVEQADQTAYGTIELGQRNVFGQAETFSIEYRPVDVAEVAASVVDDSGPEGAGRLTLDDALRIAFRSNREFQNRKEELFSRALFVANEGRAWQALLFDGPSNALAEWERPLGQGDSTTRLIEADTELSLTKRFIHGGVLTVGMALDFATDLLGSQTMTVGSLLDANFTQPLLRGGWRGIAYEDQYRLERDFAIEIYDFARFRQTFAVSIVRSYYAVLQQRDRLENERENIKRLEQTRNLTRVLADGGQVSRIELDQAEQDLLNARIRLESEQQRYQNLRDEFKITLGLPVSADIEPAYPAALVALRRFEPSDADIPFDEGGAIHLALNTRPDVLVERARLRDAERDVELAADDFLPKLDLDVGVSATSMDGSRDAQKVRFDHHQRYARLNFEYNLDQTDNRDAYRNAVIDAARARRDWQEFYDQVQLDVRQSFRELVRNRQTYELQLRNVQIARRRRILASQQQKEGQASARDVLEAEESLRNAQNGLTNALISYTTTRLDFLATLGMLQVETEGRIDERNAPQTADRIQQRYPYIAPAAKPADTPQP